MCNKYRCCGAWAHAETFARGGGGKPKKKAAIGRKYPPTWQIVPHKEKDGPPTLKKPPIRRKRSPHGQCPGQEWCCPPLDIFPRATVWCTVVKTVT